MAVGGVCVRTWEGGSGWGAAAHRQGRATMPRIIAPSGISLELAHPHVRRRLVGVRFRVRFRVSTAMKGGRPMCVSGVCGVSER